MAHLLHIDSSPLGDFSISRALTAEYARDWHASNRGGSIITGDLYRTPLPPVDSAWIKAIHTPAAQRTIQDRAALTTSDELISEIRDADSFLFGVPMQDFAVPATLKLWIDQIVWPGETFRYGEHGPVGLLTGKTAIVIMSSGGVYGPDDASQSTNFVEPYLRTILGSIGVTDVGFVAAGDAAAVSNGKIGRNAFLAPYVPAIHSRFAA